MEYYNWKNKIVNTYQNNNESKLKQFNIEKLNESDLLYKTFLENNIFGFNRNDAFYNLKDNNKSQAIIVGFGNNGILHAGHYIIVKELLYYLKNYNSKIYFVNLDPNNDNSFIYKLLEMLKINYSMHINYEIITCETIEVMKLRKLISNNISINMINRVMGWKNESLNSYEKALDMITTFSLSNLIPEENKIVISDINQATFYALLKNINNKMKLEMPNFTYHLLLPSLKSPIERMSIKKSKSIIYLDADEEVIRKKLMSSYTGINDRQYTCSFLRIFDLANKIESTNEAIINCENCDFSCSECKKNNIDKLVKQLHHRKVE